MKKVKKHHIRAALAAVSILGISPWTFAATSAPNSDTSFADSVAALEALAPGGGAGLPAGIQAALDRLTGIVTTEQTAWDQAQTDIAAAQAAVDAANAIGDTTAAAAALAQRQAAETDAIAAKAKIDLVNDAIFAADTGAVAVAQKNADDAAAAVKAAADAYKQGTQNVGGLQNVIDTVNGLPSGDPSVQDAAVATALGTYDGGSGDLAAIADLANATAQALNDLPPISDANKQTALDTVLNGSWEREAIMGNADSIAANTQGIATNVQDIATNTQDIATNAQNIATNVQDIATNAQDIAQNASDIAANAQAIADEASTRENLIRRDADGAIHIGNNSLITNEVGGEQQLYAQDAGGNAIDINVTNGSQLRQDGVLVATVDDVATEATRATTRENQIETDSIARDTALGVRIDDEATARIAADTALGIRIDDEAATRTAADNALGVRIDDEAATRAAADSRLQANIDATRIDLQASIDAESARARTVEAALDNRVTSLEGRTSALEARTARNTRDIKTLRRGISMAAALQTPVIGEGKNNAAKIGVAYFDGETGLAAGYARRLNSAVTVNAEVATTDDFDDVMARAGVNYTW
ncbi:MAG: YadA-like family protein [Opitutaceae bacterium]|jgi:hypothetical protein|nr:YadA-like family protein [Opitutaceae bacterium]